MSTKYMPQKRTAFKRIGNFSYGGVTARLGNVKKGTDMKTIAYGRSTLQAIGITLTLGLLQSCILTKSESVCESDYTYTVLDGKATVTGFSKEYAGALSVAKKLGGCPVTAIGKNAFQSCTNLTGVTIPNSVTDIKLAAFCGCRNLKSVTIPGSVDNIEKGAFFYCGLTNVTIGAGVKNIDNGAFECCAQLTTVVIPPSVTNIAALAFSGCTGLRDVSIGEGVTSLGPYAFSGCTSLTHVIFTGNAPDRIREDPFRNAGKATVYYLPGTKGWGPELCGRPTQCGEPKIRHD